MYSDRDTFAEACELLKPRQNPKMKPKHLKYPLLMGWHTGHKSISGRTWTKWKICLSLLVSPTWRSVHSSLHWPHKPHCSVWVWVFCTWDQNVLVSICWWVWSGPDVMYVFLTVSTGLLPYHPSSLKPLSSSESYYNCTPSSPVGRHQSQRLYTGCFSWVPVVFLCMLQK